jgi:hypothetical protein
MVFAFAFGTLGVSTAEPPTPAAPGEQPTAITGQTHMAVQGTNWVAELPHKFKRWRPYAWGVMTRAKAPTQQWVHIAVPTPTFIDGTQLNVFHVEFCATAARPTLSAPVAVHLWANAARVYTENIVWPNTKDQYCHQIDFSPATWMESVGISVLVNYADERHKVTLNKAWIALVP